MLLKRGTCRRAIFDLGRTLVIKPKRHFQILRINRAHFCASCTRLTFNPKMCRYPAIGGKTEALDKILFNKDLVITGRQFVRITGYGKWIGKRHSRRGRARSHRQPSKASSPRNGGKYSIFLIGNQETINWLEFQLIRVFDFLLLCRWGRRRAISTPPIKERPMRAVIKKRLC